eukprot:315510_1
MASLQGTSSADVEGSSANEDARQQTSVDYVELLRTSLRRQKLEYIAGIIKEEEDVTLQELLDWSYDDIVEQLLDIHNNENNEHKVKVSHRNKFARTVQNVKQSKLDCAQTIASPSPSTNKMKLLIIGKEEEECIEAIQSGQQFMEQAVIKTKELLNDLDENKSSFKNKVSSICDELRQQITAKQNEMNTMIESIHQRKLQQLNERQNVTIQSAKVVAKFYNDYESYFSDDSITKLDRKNKLLSAKEAIQNETEKIKQYEDTVCNMNVNIVSNKDMVDKCCSMVCLDLPPLEVEVQGFIIKWTPPILNALSQRNDDDDRKEEQPNMKNIRYSILYRKAEEKNEKWDEIVDIMNVNEYDLSLLSMDRIEAKMFYTVNGALKSPLSTAISITGYVTQWSPDHKGSKIQLTDNNTKALQPSGDQCVRGVHPIKRGMMVKINYLWYSCRNYDLIGVISSEYNGDYNTHAWNDEIIKHVTGIETSDRHYFGGKRATLGLGWKADIPSQQETKIQMIADYTISDECRLSFYVDGEFKGPKDAKYSMLLPANKVWFPIVGFDDNNNFCKIIQ